MIAFENNILSIFHLTQIIVAAQVYPFPFMTAANTPQGPAFSVQSSGGGRGQKPDSFLNSEL